MTENILLALFVVAMIANAIALYRHYWALRMLNCVLSGLILGQQQFAEMHEASLAPKKEDHHHELR
jgi:hypothetical protein